LLIPHAPAAVTKNTAENEPRAPTESGDPAAGREPLTGDPGE
jgi:hypothetical protein